MRDDMAGRGIAGIQVAVDEMAARLLKLIPLLIAPGRGARVRLIGDGLDAEQARAILGGGYEVVVGPATAQSEAVKVAVRFRGDPAADPRSDQAIDSGGARMVVASHARGLRPRAWEATRPKGLIHDAEYALFPSSTDPRWLLDREGDVRKALAAYNPSRVTGRLLKAVAVRTPGSVLQLALGGSVSVWGSAEGPPWWWPVALGGDRPSLGAVNLLGARPGALLLDGRGDPWAFVKVACDSAQSRSLQTEAARLEELRGATRCFEVPRLLARHDAGGGRPGNAIIVSAISHRAHSWAWPLDPLMRGVVGELSRIGQSRGPLAKTAFWAAYERLRDETLPSAGGPWRRRLGHAEQLVLASAEKRRTPLCLTHGDLASSNVLVTKEGRPLVLDWEVSTPDGPAGFDASYWVVQSSLLDGADARVILDRLRPAPWPRAAGPAALLAALAVGSVRDLAIVARAVPDGSVRAAAGRLEVRGQVLDALLQGEPRDGSGAGGDVEPRTAAP